MTKKSILVFSCYYLLWKTTILDNSYDLLEDYEAKLELYYQDMQTWDSLTEKEYDFLVKIIYLLSDKAQH